MEPDNDSRLFKEYIKIKNSGKEPYFDVDQFDNILEYLDSVQELEYLDEVLALALKLHPSNETLLIWKLRALVMNWQYKEALKFTESLPNPENVDCLKLKHICNFELERYSDVFNEIKELAQKEYPQLEELCLTLAEELYQIASFKITEEFILLCIELMPQSQDLHIEYSTMLKDEHQTAKAISYCNEVLDKHPYFAEVWYELGCIYSSIGKFDKAIEACDFGLASVNDDDQDFKIDLKLAKIEALINNESYIKAIEVLKELYPDVNEIGQNNILVRIAKCYYSMKDYDNAYTYYKKADRNKVERRFSDYILELAITCIRLQYLKEARAFIERELILNPKSRVFIKLKNICNNMEASSESVSNIINMIEQDSELSRARMNNSCSYELIKSFLQNSINRN